jgi:hypothetical protein
VLLAAVKMDCFHPPSNRTQGIVGQTYAPTRIRMARVSSETREERDSPQVQ